MRAKLKRLASIAIPAFGMALAAASFGARAAQDPVLDGFIGKPVYDSSGALYGTVTDVFGDGAQSIALVTRENGETVSVPLGNTDVIVADLTAPQAVVYAYTQGPVVIVPEYRTPESRGS